MGYGKQDRYAQAPEANTFGIPAKYGIQGVPQVTGNGGLPYIGVGDLASMGPSPYTPTIFHSHSLQIIDNVTKLYGKHVFKMGIDVNSLEGDIDQPPWRSGTSTSMASTPTFPLRTTEHRNRPISLDPDCQHGSWWREPSRRALRPGIKCLLHQRSPLVRRVLILRMPSR